MKITLCGSAKFEYAFHTWNELLTLNGHTVYSLAVFPSIKGEKNWYNQETKMLLDLAHLSKIEESDAIVVLNEDHYIGESIHREIKWAELRGKLIYYTYPGDNQESAAQLVTVPAFLARSDTSPKSSG